MRTKVIFFMSLFFTLLLEFIYVAFIESDKLSLAYLEKVYPSISGYDAPRGRILDRNGNVLVGNEKSYVLTYTYEGSVPLDILEQINLVFSISDDLDSLQTKLKQGDSKTFLTLKEDIGSYLCEASSSYEIYGFSCQTKYTRTYAFPGLKTFFGSIGYMTSDVKDYYTNLNNYTYVGLSGLELYYDSLLRGNPGSFIYHDGHFIRQEEESSGTDLVLGMDYTLQTKMISIVGEEVLNSKNYAKTKYYKGSAAIISDVNTGEILGITYQKLDGDGNLYDATYELFSSSYLIGSTIKGASSTVGYLYGGITPGKKVKDQCIYLKNLPGKCSYKELGYVDDISALKMSSNSFQFMSAIQVSGKSYIPGMKLDVDSQYFSLYRDTYALYGLGTSTGIDYPKENVGIKGSTYSDDLYLNLVIGQYDTYSLLSLSSYINTIALKGVRNSLTFKKGNSIYLNSVPLESRYYDRIQQGFYDALHSGTALGYMDSSYDGYGKTGTAEVYYSKDVTTLNSLFIGVDSIKDPKYSIVVISPNVSYETENDTYKAPITRRIVKRLTSVYFY